MIIKRSVKRCFEPKEINLHKLPYYKLIRMEKTDREEKKEIQKLFQKNLKSLFQKYNQSSKTITQAQSSILKPSKSVSTNPPQPPQNPLSSLRPSKLSSQVLPPPRPPTPSTFSHPPPQKRPMTQGQIPHKKLLKSPNPPAKPRVTIKEQTSSSSSDSSSRSSKSG